MISAYEAKCVIDYVKATLKEDKDYLIANDSLISLCETVVALQEFVPDARRLFQMTIYLARSGWDNTECQLEVLQALCDMADALAVLNSKEAPNGTAGNNHAVDLGGTVINEDCSLGPM